MRIEVLVENEDPMIFPLNKPKILIGAHEACDIILNAPGISRKHIGIINENESFFVVDQGSTNGSYINEERLVPGRRAEFNSFFPVRLGDNVLITLLSDEEGSRFGLEETLPQPPKREVVKEAPAENTRAISLQELRAAKTQNLVKKRQEVVKRKTTKARPKKAPIKDNSRMRLVQLICLAILGVAIYVNFYVQKPEESMEANTTPEVRPAPKPPEPVKPKFTLVDEIDVTPKSKFESIEQNTTCVNDLEKYLCELMAPYSARAVQSGTMLYVFADGQKSYARAKSEIKDPSTSSGGTVSSERMKAYRHDLLLVSMILFLNESIPATFDPKRLAGHNLTIILKLPTEPADYSTIAVTPDSLKKLVDMVDQNYIGYLKKYGPNTWYFFREYFRMDFSPPVAAETPAATVPATESSETLPAPVSPTESTTPSPP